MRIYKYEVDLTNPCTEMPQAAKILSCAYQGDNLMVWALVNEEAPLVTRDIVIYGTGHPVEEIYGFSFFIGTVFQGPFVWHLFDGGEI